MARKFFVGGNFKIQSIKKIVENLNQAKLDPSVEVVIAPPTLYLPLVKSLLPSSSAIQLAAQNVSPHGPGAFTGEVAVSQLRDVGCHWTLAGHSERRTLLAESDAFVADKVQAALAGGLRVVFCCGESLEEREAGTTIDVVTRQLDAVRAAFSKAASSSSSAANWGDDLVIAYEPIWAIGTGKVATTEQAQEVHAAIRAWLAEQVGADAAERTRIIYGGSVSEKNCHDLGRQPDIDGFLVGGASLKPALVDIVNCKA